MSCEMLFMAMRHALVILIHENGENASTRFSLFGEQFLIALTGNCKTNLHQCADVFIYDKTDKLSIVSMQVWFKKLERKKTKGNEF